MRHKFLNSAWLLLVFFMSACSSSHSQRSDSSQSSQPTAVWQDQHLYVDGSDQDWTGSLPFVDNTEKFRYAISNDGENIYIRIATNNQHTQQKIIQGGMTVWINSQAQKEFDGAVGIGYPTDSRTSREKTLMAEAQPDRYKGGTGPLNLEDCKDYSLFNFSREEAVANYEYGQANKEGILVKMNYNNAGSLIYEASIPLVSVFPKNNSTGKSIAVGIYLEGIPGAKDSPQDGGGGGVSVGGGLGFGSFGSGGGLGVSIGSGSLARIGGKKGSLSKQGKTWQVVDIARPQK